VVVFFSEDIANAVQFVSMFLELGGLTLAFIELKYENLANTIEQGILKSEQITRNLADKMMENKLFSSIITLFIVVMFLIEIPSLAGFYDAVLPKEYLTILDNLQIGAFIIIGLTAFGFGIVFFSEFIGALNKFSNGKAIGAFGIFMAFCGLMGEVYQVAFIFLPQ